MWQFEITRMKITDKMPRKANEAEKEKKNKTKEWKNSYKKWCTCKPKTTKATEAMRKRESNDGMKDEIIASKMWMHFYRLTPITTENNMRAHVNTSASHRQQVKANHMRRYITCSTILGNSQATGNNVFVCELNEFGKREAWNNSCFLCFFFFLAYFLLFFNICVFVSFFRTFVTKKG